MTLSEYSVSVNISLAWEKKHKLYELSQIPSFVFHLFEVEGAAHPPVCGEERENGGAVDLFPLPVATLKHGVL